MPYNDVKDLPESVRNTLPFHAQEIFKEAFNASLDEYKKEETAFKVAWSAVKNKYHKDKDGNWTAKD